MGGRRTALLGYLLSTFASQYIWVTFSPVATDVAGRLGVPPVWVGYLAASYPALFLLLTVPSGVLLDRDLGLWLRFGMAVTALGGVGRLAAPESYPWLAACQLAAAVGQPFLLNGFVPFASRQGGSRAAVISALSLSMYLGAISALAVGRALYGWGGVTALALPGAVASAAGLALAFPSLPAGRGAGGFPALRPVAGRRELWLLGGILGLGIATFDNLATWLQPALDTAGRGHVAGVAMASTMAMGLAGIALFPVRVSRANSRAYYVRGAAAAVTATFAAVAFSAEPFLLPLAGLVMIPAYPVVMEWVGRLVPGELHGSAAGFLGLVSRALSTLLVLAAPAFIGEAGRYFLFLACCTAAAFLLALMLPNDRRGGAYR